jgi:sterol desaturase/sphingolipid hydroxylase (fatty acid hydroxylase superfamily)
MEALRKIWNFEISEGDPLLTNGRLIKAAIWVIAVGFAVFTVMISSVVPGAHSLTIFNIQEVIHQYQSGNLSLTEIRQYLPYVWMVVAIAAVISRSIITIHSYYLSVEQIGEKKFNRYFSTFITTFFIGTATLFLLTVFGWIALAQGYDADWAGAFINGGVSQFNAFIVSIIPFSLKLQNYWLALLLSIFLAYLPGYIVHSLCHRSRLLWLSLIHI